MCSEAPRVICCHCVVGEEAALWPILSEGIGLHLLLLAIHHPSRHRQTRSAHRITSSLVLRNVFKLSLALTRARRTRSVFYGPVRGRTRAPVRCGVSGSDYPRGEAMLPLCSDVKCLVNWKRAQLISLLHTSSGRLPAILPPVAV